MSKAILGKWDFIFLLGESGGGKGTLVKNMKKYWIPNLKSSSTGDMLREKSLTDPEMKKLTDEGILVGDDIVFRLFHEFATENTPGLMDGFPRNRQQALDTIKFIKEKRWRVLVIDIYCDIEVIIERLLQRGREDDKLAIMYKRNLTHKTLHPVVMEEIKRRRDLFDVISLDGNRPEEIVFTNLLLNLLREVDMLYFYEFNSQTHQLSVNPDETTINPALNRFLSGMLQTIQQNIDAQ